MLQRLEGRQLLGGEESPLAGLDGRIIQGSELDAAQLGDRVAHGGEHAADLLVLAFDEGHLQPRVLGLLGDLDAAGLQPLAVQAETGAEFIQGLDPGHPVHLGQVDLGHVEFRGHEALAISPSLVMRSSPSELKSRRPTG